MEDMRQGVSSGPPSSISDALTNLDSSFDKVLTAIDGGALAGLDKKELKQCRRQLASVSDQMSEVDRQLILSSERAGLPALLGYESMTDYMVKTLGLSRDEASRRIAAAHGFAIAPSVLGE